MELQDIYKHYNDKKWVCWGAYLFYDNENSKKIAIGLPQNHQAITMENSFEHQKFTVVSRTRKEFKINAICIGLGARSNIICLDFDDISVYKEHVEKFPFLKEQYSEQTQRGIHVIFPYEKRFKKNFHKIFKIDILMDGKFMYAAPTFYKRLNEEVEYQLVENSQLLNPMPEEYYQFILSEYRRQNGIPEPEPEVHSDTEHDLNPETENNFKKRKIDRLNSGMSELFKKCFPEQHIDKLNILKIIKDCFSLERINDYTSYINLTFAWKRTFQEAERKIQEEAFEIWKSIVSKSPKFNQKDEDNYWEKMADREKNRQNGFGSLIYYAKKDDEQKFYELLPYFSDYDEQNEVVYNDEQAVNLLRKKLGNRVVYCKNVLYFKKNNTYTTNSKDIKNHISSYILHSKFKTGVDISEDPEKGHDPEIKNVYYCSTVRKCQELKKQLLEELTVKNVDNTFDEKMRRSCVGKVCFTDGVYNLFTHTFYPWDDLPEPIYSRVEIPHKYEPVDLTHPIQKKEYEEARFKVFEEMFQEDTNQFLKVLGRAMAGHCDKNWYVVKSKRNAGKSNLIQILEDLFGDYVGTTDCHNFYSDKQTSGESAREFSWLVPIKDNRLTFISEAKQKTRIDPKTNDIVATASTINGILIKKIQSNGDTFQGRELYSDPINFKMETTLMFMNNCMPRVEPPDTNEMRYDFEIKTRFVPFAPEEIEFEFNHLPETEREHIKPQNDDVLKNAKTIWRKYIIHMIFSAYVPEKIKPNYVDESDKQYKNCEDYINRFVQADNTARFLLCDLEKYFKNKFPRMNWKIIKAMIEKNHPQRKDNARFYRITITDNLDL